MPAYRRFVAYVYEYRHGKKEDNCGFIQVEVREEKCKIKMHIRCPGLPAGTSCELSGIVRTQTAPQRARIGICQTIQDGVECLFTCTANNLDNYGTSVNDIGGLILITMEGAFFGTEWDDVPIQSNELLHAEYTNEKNKISRAEVYTTPGNKQGIKQETKHAIIQDTNQEAGKEIKQKIKEDTEEDAQEKNRVIIEETKTLITSKNNSQNELIEKNDNGKEPDIQIQEIKRTLSTTFEPFSDGEITDCHMVKSLELNCLCQKDRMLRNNRFLSHGYHTFGHVIIGKTRANQYILGVPGGYDEQERFMASMFGFPYFKESQEIRLGQSRGGYWYRFIDAPNFDNGDRA